MRLLISGKLKRARMAWRVALLLATLAGAESTALAAAAEHGAMLKQAHAWGRFAKGSWREVQIVTETFDDEGRPANSSTTDNKTTVEEVTPERVTLKVEVTVEVAGQRIPSQPQIIKQGYAGENVGQTVSIKTLNPETLVIDGRELRCETGQIEIIGGVSKEVSLISFAPRSTPTILRRKSTTIDPATSKTTQETVSEVYALGRYFRVLDEIKSGYTVRLVQKNDHGVTTTWSDRVPEVPGEVIVECSKKIDNEGRLVRRSTLELVAYGVDGEEVHRDPTPRRVRRPKRAR